MKNVQFEMTGENTFKMLEDGIVTLQNIDFEIYDTIRHDMRDPDKLVPYDYLQFMRRPGVNDKTIDWDKCVRPFLPARTNDCVYPFQREAICKMVSSKRCLNATSMGCGKTLQALCALAGINQLNGDKNNNLILCPGYLRDNWADEIIRWLGPQFVFYKIEKSSKTERENSLKQLIHLRGTKIVSYDMAANLLSFTFIVERDLKGSLVHCTHLRSCTMWHHILPSNQEYIFLSPS